MSERKDKQEMARVETAVLNWIVQGASVSNIIRDLKAFHGFKSDVNCRRVISKVTKRLQDNNEADLEKARAVYRQRYEDLYQKAVLDGRINDARAILDSMAKIDGVIIQKIEQKTTQAYNIEFS